MCKEYGWTLDYIRYKTTPVQTILLMNKIKKRKKMEKLSNFENLIVAFRGDSKTINELNDRLLENKQEIVSDKVLDDIGISKND